MNKISPDQLAVLRAAFARHPKQLSYYDLRYSHSTFEALVRRGLFESVMLGIYYQLTDQGIAAGKADREQRMATNGTMHFIGQLFPPSHISAGGE